MNVELQASSEQKSITNKWIKRIKTQFHTKNFAFEWLQCNEAIVHEVVVQESFQFVSSCKKSTIENGDPRFVKRNISTIEKRVKLNKYL